MDQVSINFDETITTDEKKVEVVKEKMKKNYSLMSGLDIPQTKPSDTVPMGSVFKEFVP
jgi:hypothetical protein